jgi:hypothetical protein
MCLVGVLKTLYKSISHGAHVQDWLHTRSISLVKCHRSPFCRVWLFLRSHPSRLPHESDMSAWGRKSCRNQSTLLAKKILRWWDPLYFCWANDVTSWLHRQTCLFHYGCWVFMLPRPVIHGCATLTPRLREGKGHVKNQSSTQLAVFKFFQLWVKNGKNHLWIQHSHQFHLPKEPGCQTL